MSIPTPVGFNPFSKHDWEHLSDKTKDALNGAIKDARRDIAHAQTDAIAQVKHVETEAAHSLDKVGTQIEAQVKHIRDSVFKRLASLSINKAVDVIQATAPDSFTLTLGLFSFGFDDAQARVDTLQKYANHPPSLAHMPDIVKAIAPDNVTVDLSAEIAFLLVASDSLAVGFSATYTYDGFITRYASIRKSIGV